MRQQRSSDVTGLHQNTSAISGTREFVVIPRHCTYPWQLTTALSDENDVRLLCEVSGTSPEIQYLSIG